jgi:hypothetical protein
MQSAIHLHAFTESVNDILPRMLKITKTKNWTLYWGVGPLPDGAKAIGLVTPGKEPTGVLIRLADGTYVQGKAGEVRSLSQRAVEKALATADDGDDLETIQAKAKARPRRKSLRP